MEVSTKPVEAAVGAGEPHGKTKTCQADATLVSGLIGCVQFSTAEFVVIAATVIAVGIRQLGGGPQVIFETHPGLLSVPSLLNLKVKQPLALEEVKGPGIVVPQYPPAKAPGTFPAPLALAI